MGTALAAIGASDVMTLIIDFITSFFTALPSVFVTGFENLMITGTGETATFSLLFIYLTAMFAIALVIRLVMSLINRIRG